MNRTLALVTDLHLNEPFTDRYQVDSRGHWLRILADIKQRNIRDLVILGDLSEHDGLDFFFESIKTNALNLKLVLGNHDNLSFVAQHTDLEKSYSTEEYPNYKFIYLDSSAEEIDEVQLKWFEHESRTHKPLIVFVHHPIIDCHTKMDEVYPLREREQLESILKLRVSRTYIFCGHYHIENIQRVEKIQQIVTPACSIQLDPENAKVDVNNRRFGYRILNIYPDNLTHEVVWF